MIGLSRLPGLVLGVLFFIAVTCALAQAEQKDAVGWLEKVRIYPTDIVVHGKLDTGADYSSLNATNLREYDRNGKKWISFEVSNRFGQKATLEQPILRIAMVKKHFGQPQRRPVVRLGICLGTHYMEADVNLVDRTNFENQMLLGRSFLAGNVLIDPATTFTAEPQCKKSSAP